jgi:hypothetical protein
MKPHRPEGTPTHAWLLDPLSGIVHLVRAKDGHACCAPVYVKAKPSCTRWQPDLELSMSRRCALCAKWCAHYVAQQNRADAARMRLNGRRLH